MENGFPKEIISGIRTSRAIIGTVHKSPLPANPIGSGKKPKSRKVKTMNTKTTNQKAENIPWASRTEAQKQEFRIAHKDSVIGKSNQFYQMVGFLKRHMDLHAFSVEEISALKFPQAEMLIAEIKGKLAGALASDPQKNYMKTLGVEYTEATTFEEAKVLIRTALAKDKPAVQSKPKTEYTTPYAELSDDEKTRVNKLATLGKVWRGFKACYFKSAQDIEGMTKWATIIHDLQTELGFELTVQYKVGDKPAFVFPVQAPIVV